MPKVLVLSVSAGAVHVRAAEALCAYAKADPAGVEAVHLDVMDFVPASFKALYAEFYIELVARQPALWSYLYQKTDSVSPRSFGERIRRAVERLNCRALIAEIERHRADAIICTHFLPAKLLSRERRLGNVRTPVWVQVTDFDLHRMWVVPGMQGYFAANDEVAWRMVNRGIPSASIHVGGIPVMPAFSERPDRATCAAQFGLDPARRTLLMMSGGAGVGALDALAERLLKMNGDFQLIALAGHNEAMLAALRKLGESHPDRLHVSGFTPHVERLMACSDLVITKPGGLTTSECLAMHLPMVVTSPIPGQEERNADYLLEQGVALKAVDAVALEYRIRALLDDPARLHAMRGRIAPIARPYAARFVLDTVCDALGKQHSEVAA
ncbi:monogalactosyldiacylglycerol synthase [Caballeronia temeraria]|uniref:Monogalactosyldiacylglycerol synthase n=1 Tax=Caballeronia temeraria TaxID=1777137 RepID=A0A158B877_9BURK|nr:glycosyltransferase [Caballeronia temeraria]SAK66278.1 monogalactosyldiacylglycerol synthase [Caballeronia temeraria]